LSTATILRRNYVYIAGPYSGRALHGTSGYLVIEHNILAAKHAMATLVKAGYGVFCPHMHSCHFEVITPEIEIDYWYELDLYYLNFCHALLRLPGPSSGADKEVEVAREKGLPIFNKIELLLRTLPVFRDQTEQDILLELLTHSPQLRKA